MIPVKTQIVGDLCKQRREKNCTVRDPDFCTHFISHENIFIIHLTYLGPVATVNKEVPSKIPCYLEIKCFELS